MNNPSQLDPQIPEQDDEKQLCVRCLAPNLPNDHFCKNCGAPLSSFASTGPFESVFAEGQVYRQAAEQPRSFIVVLGIWLIFGTAVLAGGFVFVWAWGEQDILDLVLTSGMILFSVVILAKTTRNYFSRSLPTQDSESGMEEPR